MRQTNYSINNTSMHTRLTVNFIDVFKGWAVPVALFMGFAVGMAVCYLLV